MRTPGIVLCGPDQTLRAEFAQHLKATENRFYEEPEGGIEDIVEWLPVICTNRFGNWPPDPGYLLAADARTILESPCRQLIDHRDVSNPTPGHHRTAPPAAPLFEENPHVRQDL